MPGRIVRGSVPLAKLLCAGAGGWELRQLCQQHCSGIPHALALPAGSALLNKLVESRAGAGQAAWSAYVLRGAAALRARRVPAATSRHLLQQPPPQEACVQPPPQCNMLPCPACRRQHHPLRKGLAAWLVLAPCHLHVTAANSQNGDNCPVGTLRGQQSTLAARGWPENIPESPSEQGEDPFLLLPHSVAAGDCHKQ